ncbi:MAG: transcriptional regulator GcvA [Pseudomonadota bacterium]
MSEPLPPLNALRAFEVAARNLSFSRAAEELHVTPAALSHQIKGLEDFLGVKLFLRKPRAIELTDAGRTLYPGIHQAFGQFRQAVHSLERIRNDRVLVVSAPPGFTAKWLAPRLHRFMTANPEIDARISSTSVLVEFDAADVDITIRNSATGVMPGLQTEKLVDIWTIPVASPRLLEEIGGIEKPEDLLKTTLIFDDSMRQLPGVPYWSEFFAEHGLHDIEIPRQLQFNSADHALEAAVEGAGVLLCYRTLAYDDLRVGRLVNLFGSQMKVERAFWLVYPEGTGDRPKVKAFRDWSRAEFDKMILDCEAVGRGHFAAGPAAKQAPPKSAAAPQAKARRRTKSSRTASEQAD